MEPTGEHIENLRKEYERRLQILEMQAAKFGSSTPPHIVTEIEDLQIEIKKLDVQLIRKKSPRRLKPLKRSRFRYSQFSMPVVALVVVIVLVFLAIVITPGNQKLQNIFTGNRDYPTNVPDFTASSSISAGTVIQYSGGWNCGYDRVMPQYIDPNKDIALANTQLIEASKRGEARNYPTSLQPDGSFLQYFLEGIPTNTHALLVEKTALVSVAVSPVPDNINVFSFGQCGAGEVTIREFPPIELKSEAKKYVVENTYQTETNANEFAIGPTEANKLIFKPACRAPGIYEISIEIQYIYAGEKNRIILPPTKMICPKSYTFWSGDGANMGLEFKGRYSWDGSEYIAQR